MSSPRPGPSGAEQGPDLTTVWHKCDVEHATQAAINLYVGLALVALLVIALWIAYRRETARGGD